MASLAVDPSNAQRMYATMRDGVFTSTDGGKQWVPLAGSPQGVVTLAMDAADSRHLVGMTGQGVLYESRDAGATWGRR